MNLLHGRRLFGRWIYAGSIKTAGADTPVKYLPGMFQIIAYNADGTKTAIFGAGANNNAVSEFNFKIIETGCGECTIKFNKLPTNAELNYKQRVDIHLFNDGQPWFSGYVITRPIVGTTETSFSFVIHGFYNLLEKVQLFETYENMEVSAIVKSIAQIVEGKLGLVYNADKIINTGYTISKIVFDGVDVKKALEQLSDFGLDYVFGVDEKRSIYFKPRNTEINEQARFWVGKHLTSYVPNEDIEKVCNWARIKGAALDATTGESWLATVQDLDSQAAYGLQEEIWTLPSAYAAADAERWGNVQIQKYKDPIKSAKIKGVDLRYLNADGSFGGIMAKFSRNSTAYADDGSVVAANVPRFERIGKNLFDMKDLVEQGGLSGIIGKTFLQNCSGSVNRVRCNISTAWRLERGVTYRLTIPSGFRLGFHHYDDNGLCLGDSGWVQNGVTFTTPSSNYSYTTFVISNGTISYVNEKPLTPEQSWLLKGFQLEEGSTATAYEPYREGLLIEEGTTNLLPTSMQNRLANGSAIDPLLFSIIDGLVQGGSYTIKGKKKLYADDGTINPRVTLMLYYSDGTYTLLQTLYNQAKDDNFHDFLITQTADASKTLTRVCGWIFDHSTAPSQHSECKNVQLEQKPYATSFHPTTRAAESLTIPASALNASEGTIEFDVYKTLTNYALIPVLFDWGSNNSTDYFRLYYAGANQLTLLSKKNGGTTTGIHYNSLASINYHIGVKWYGNTMEMWVNRVKVGTGVYNGLNALTIAKLGSLQRNTQQLGGLFSNLRISNKARSDTELANTGALAVDEFTTYFLPMNGNLGAQVQGVSVSFNVRKLSTDGECVITTLDGSAIQYPITSLKYSVSPEKGIQCEMELGEQPFKIDTYFAELERNNKNNELLQQASNKQLI